MGTDLTLYELAAEYRAVAFALSDLETDDQAVNDTLAGLRQPLESKAVAVGMVAQNLDALATAIKDAEQAMASRRRALENRAARLRSYLKDNLDAAGITRIASPQFQISVKRNPPSVEISHLQDVPDEFMVKPLPPPPYPDKRLIAEALKRGEDVPGTRLETERTRLEIK
jgi:hypothetical protein